MCKSKYNTQKIISHDNYSIRNLEQQENSHEIVSLTTCRNFAVSLTSQVNTKSAHYKLQISVQKQIVECNMYVPTFDNCIFYVIINVA